MPPTSWRVITPFNMALLLPRSCTTFFFFFNFWPPLKRADSGQACSGNGPNSDGLLGPWRRLEKRLSWNWSKRPCGAEGACDLPSCLCRAWVMSLPSLNSCGECNYEQMGKWHDSTANELPYWERGQCITLLYFRLLIIILRVWCVVLCLFVGFFFLPQA